MNRIARFPVLAAATLSLLATMTGCKRLEARDQLNKGVQAYKAAKYEEAIDHFQKAVSLDPTYPMTRTYLATAYAQQVVPDLQTPENQKTAQMSINQFKMVLEKDPTDVTALKQIANLYMDLDQFDKAKDWQQKVLQTDPKDAEAAYTIGVIDWRVAYKNAIGDLRSANMQDDGQGNPKMPKQVCQEIKQQNGDVVQQGLDYLQKAIDIRPTYDDAMSYINLMYRQKANLDCGDDAARKADIQTADQWAAKALGTRRANEEKKNQGAQGIVIQQGK